MESQIEYKIIESFYLADEKSGLYDKLYEITKEIEKSYPAHKNWYYANFIGYLLKNNKGLIAFAKNSENNEISGLALINKEICKLCTLFVDPKYRRKGIATKLLYISEKSLGMKPIVTVSEDNYPCLKKIFEKNNYILSYRVLGYYQPNKIELCFNDHSKTKILDNPNTFYDIIKTDEIKKIPTYKPKIGCDYYSLFGKIYEQKMDRTSQ